MKTLLIPVDFSETTDNTITFATEWAKKYDYERIILLRSFYASMYENIFLSADFTNIPASQINRDRQVQNEHLDAMCRRLNQTTGEGIKIQTATTELPLLRGIIEITISEQPAMIMLGNDHTNNSNEAFISGNIISIAKASPVRVLIVPGNYRYKPVQCALVPCNFNTVDSLKKINSLHAAPQWRDVKIILLNVDAKQHYLNPDDRFREAEQSLHDYLKNFEHKIYYVGDKNVINGILNFDKIDDVQLMIALPGKYSFLYSFTHISISEALYRNTRIPVMILK